MAFVLDSSVTLAWFLPDEGGEALDRLADRLQQETAYVPCIWPLEVGNALLVAQRRGRIRDSELARMMAALDRLPVEVDMEGSRGGVQVMAEIARSHGLTTYDAAYVELAHRRGVALATLDDRLRKACETLGVPLLP